MFFDIIVYHCYYINIHIDIVFSDHGRSIIYNTYINIIYIYILYSCISMYIYDM